MPEPSMVAWAADEAKRLLAPLGDRWVHTLAVVQCAHIVGAAGAHVDAEVLVAAAYLHDVGYAAELRRTGHHGIDGALYLRGLGHERLARLVAHHSASAAEADARGLSDELGAFPCEASPTADALTYCDILTGPTGETVTLAERLADVERRYGAAHAVTRSLVAAVPSLEEAVARTQRLVAGQRPG